MLLPGLLQEDCGFVQWAALKSLLKLMMENPHLSIPFPEAADHRPNRAPPSDGRGLGSHDAVVHEPLL